MIKDVEMIVFDMAGTTVTDKNEVEHCFLEAVKQTGIETNLDEINAMMGWSKLTVFETLWRRQLAGAPAMEIAAKIENSYTIFTEILEAHYLSSEVLPTKGCVEIFEFVKKENIRLALTTGFYRKVTDIILHKLGWDEGLDGDYKGKGLINASISSDQVKAGRPAPFMVFRTMELCGISDVRKIIKIGDTPSDLAEGKNAGCKLSLGVTNGTHTESQLKQYENDGLYNDLVDFRLFLETLKQ